MTASEKAEKNKHYRLKITDTGSKGEGIGRIDGFPVFVENAVKGDLIEVRIVKVKKSYAYGKLINVIEKSPYRAEPECAYYPRCGGCNLRHLSYGAQLDFKTEKVRSCLERIGGFKGIDVKRTLGMTKYYRNKAQFPVGMADGRAVIGFYAKRSHNIVDCRSCLIQSRENERIVDVIREFIEKYSIPIYDEKNHTGVLRHIITRTSKAGEAAVTVVVNADKLKNSDKLVEMLTEDKNVVSISLNVNRERTNVILGKQIKHLWGSKYLTDYIGDLKFEISPVSFYQVNPEQTEVLYSKALEFAALEDGGQTVIDAYCGIGTISLFLAKRAKKVYGVEIVPQAIEDAKRNASINGIDNAEFIAGAAEEIIPEMYSQSGLRADVIIIDPPRKGCHEKLLDVIAQIAPKRVVYISCDPATLARDLKYLCPKGFEINQVQPVDMFCMNSHVETVVLLSKNAYTREY